MKLIVALVWLLVLTAGSAGAQLMLPPSPNQFDEKGFRTGHWTITYDSLWRETPNEDSIHYYRLVRFEQGKPAGKVRDFYRTGVKQWEGYLSSLSPEVFDGECLTFHENGRLKYRHHYRNGVAWGPAEEFYATGQRMSTGEYRNDQKWGTWTFYFEDGKVAAVVGFRNNLWNGPALFNHSNGQLDHRGSYIDEKADGKHEYFSASGVPTMTVHYRRDTLHGPAEFYNDAGHIQEAGLFREGIKYGEWKSYHPNGQVASAGKYAGVREGTWIFYHDNGSVFERGTMKQGSKEGVWEQFTSTGTKEAREEFREGKRHGESVRYFPDGRLKQQARYESDSLVGAFVEYGDEGKEITRGRYVANRRDGPWVFSSPSGQRLEEGAYQDGLKTEPWKTYYDSGVLSRLNTYNRDTLEGSYETYFPSSRRSETGSYRQGEREGEYTSYFENGKPEIAGRHERGFKQGVWRYYFDSGALQVELTWQEDTLVGPFTFFYPDGTPNVRGLHDHGQRQGEFTYFYPDGKRKATGTYQAGKENGLWLYYDSLSGMKESEVPYILGKRHGLVQFYTAGKVSSHGYFVHGFEENYQNIRDSVNRLMALKEYDKALAAVAWMERVIKRDTKTWSAQALPSSYYSNIYYAQNLPQKSLGYALENLKYHKKNKAVGTEGYGISVHNVAAAYSRMGQWQKAVPYFDESIAIAARQGINDSYWTSVIGKVYALMDNGQSDEAARIMASEWALATQHYGIDSAATFPLERKIGDFHFYKRNDHTEAARWYDSLRVRMERRRLTTPDLFQCYRQLAHIEDKSKGDYPAAIPFYQAGLRLAEQTDLYTTEYDQLLVDYYSLRIVHAPDDEVSKAINSRMLNRVEITDDPSARANMYQALGLLAYRATDYAKAIDYQQKGLAVCQLPDLEESEVHAALLQNYAVSLQAVSGSDPDHVLRMYEQSLKIYAKLLGRSAPDYFVSLIEYGGLCVGYRRFDEAIAALNEGLSILEDGRAPNYRAKANMYLAQAFDGRFEFHLAIPLFEKAAVYYEQDRDQYLSELEIIYGSLAGCYKEDFTKARAAAEKALEACIARYGKESPKRLYRLSKIGQLESNHGLPNQGRKRYQEVAEGYVSLGMKESPEYVSALLGVMHADVLMREYARARDLGIRLIPEAERTLGVNNHTTLSVLYELSLAYEGLRDDANQERCLRRLVATLRAEENLDLIGQLSLASYELALGSLFMQRNRLVEAEEILESAARGVRDTELGTRSAMGSYVTMLAQVKERIGKNSEAEKLYGEAFQLATADSANDVTAYVDAGRNLAVFYRMMGRNSEAEALLERLSQFYLRHRQADLDYASLRGLLVWLYYLRADDKEALAEANRLLAIAEAEGGVGHPTTLGLHNNIGVIYYDTDQFEAAGEQFQYCVDGMLRRKDLSNSDKGTLAIYYGNMADVEMALGRIPAAENFLAQRNALRQSAGTVLTAVQRATALQQDAMLSQMKGDWANAERLWQTILRSLMSYIQENFAFQSEEEKTRFWNAVNGPFKRFRSFAVERSAQNPALLGDLYNLQLTTKGILLASSNSIRKRLLGSRDSSMVNQYYHWMKLREQLGQRYAQPGHPAAEIDSLKRLINTLEKEMNVSAEDIRQEKGGASITWKQVQASLAPDEAAVEIIRYKYVNNYFRDSIVYVALVLTDKTVAAPARVILPHGKLLEKPYYAAYKNAILYQLEDTVSYQRYWAPLDRVIGARRKIYLSLDGVYHQISLNALRMPDGAHLAEQKSLTLLSNTKDILVLKNRKPPKRRSLHASLFGFPKFYLGGDGQGASGSDRSGIYPLAGTRLEIDSVAELLGKRHIRTDVFVGDGATEAALKRLRQPTLVHVATHGFFVEEGKPSSFRLTGVNEENPLNRSGLLLAGAADFVLNQEFNNEENGILTAYEVSNLSLESAELVALSACETGKGVVQNGEGVYGLQRAFQSAGASSILLSLWKVDDDATRQLMTKFYRYWLEGQPKAEALRRAQVATKAHYPHPFYWAAFVLMEN